MGEATAMNDVPDETTKQDNDEVEAAAGPSHIVAMPKPRQRAKRQQAADAPWKLELTDQELMHTVKVFCDGKYPLSSAMNETVPHTVIQQKLAAMFKQYQESRGSKGE